jgi:hypothetical protein
VINFVSLFSFSLFVQRRDLVNTAILTSRQVAEPLRVFMVTQAGKVADVTLQASCSSVDESVLKVLRLYRSVVVGEGGKKALSLSLY